MQAWQKFRKRGTDMIRKWEYREDKVCLEYHDGEEVFVNRSDFDRAFGTIINASKEDIKRDFAIM